MSEQDRRRAQLERATEAPERASRDAWRPTLEELARDFEDSPEQIGHYFFEAEARGELGRDDIARACAALAYAFGDRFARLAFGFGRGPSAGDLADAIVADARRGFEGAPRPLPHRGALQPLFGRYDLASFEAYVGGPAREAADRLGARAYVAESRAVFAEEPSLATAAHEAAHLVQQRQGYGTAGLSKASEPLERQAREVAARAARGLSVEGVLDRAPAGASALSGVAVQRETEWDQLEDEEKSLVESQIYPSTYRMLERGVAACVRGNNARRPGAKGKHGIRAAKGKGAAFARFWRNLALVRLLEGRESYSVLKSSTGIALKIKDLLPAKAATLEALTDPTAWEPWADGEQLKLTAFCYHRFEDVRVDPEDPHSAWVGVDAGVTELEAPETNPEKEAYDDTETAPRPEAGAAMTGRYKACRDASGVVDWGGAGQEKAPRWKRLQVAINQGGMHLKAWRFENRKVKGKAAETIKRVYSGDLMEERDESVSYLMGAQGGEGTEVWTFYPSTGVLELPFRGSPAFLWRASADPRMSDDAMDDLPEDVREDVEVNEDNPIDPVQWELAVAAAQELETLVEAWASKEAGGRGTDRRSGTAARIDALFGRYLSFFTEEQRAYGVRMLRIKLLQRVITTSEASETAYTWLRQVAYYHPDVATVIATQLEVDAGGERPMTHYYRWRITCWGPELTVDFGVGEDGPSDDSGRTEGGVDVGVSISGTLGAANVEIERYNSADGRASANGDERRWSASYWGAIGGGSVGGSFKLGVPGMEALKGTAKRLLNQTIYKQTAWSDLNTPDPWGMDDFPGWIGLAGLEYWAGVGKYVGQSPAGMVTFYGTGKFPAVSGDASGGVEGAKTGAGAEAGVGVQVMKIYRTSGQEEDFVLRAVPIETEAKDVEAGGGGRGLMFFDNAEPELTEAGRQALRELVAEHRAIFDSPGSSIAILGYADASGEAEQNLKLSKARARNVRQALIDILGADHAAAGQMACEGLGDEPARAAGSAGVDPRWRKATVLLDGQVRMTLR